MLNIEEIYSQLSSHMVKGVMFHEQMADYYDFLNLHGYKRCHEMHAFAEFKGLRRLHRYFINHYNKLVTEAPVESPEAIPASWLKYSRQDVDIQTRRNAVKAGIEKWVEWETETKKLYQDMYRELMSLGEVASANTFAECVTDVDRELKYAQRKHITLMSVDYDIDYIVMEQDALHEEFKEATRKVGEGL